MSIFDRFRFPLVGAMILSGVCISAGAQVLQPPTNLRIDAGTCTAPAYTPGGSDGRGGCFPGLANTGVPTGTVLTTYSGPCTITTNNTVIDSKDMRGCGSIIVKATGLVIRKSWLPWIETYPTASMIIQDSQIDAGTYSGSAVAGYNYTLTRIRGTGGQHTITCDSNCTIEYSYLHAQYLPAGQDWHNNAFLTNGANNVTIRFNTLHCDVLVNSAGGGCSAAGVSLFADFAPVSNVLVEGNLIRANNSSASYCVYGGSSGPKPYSSSPSNGTNVRFVNNVFERGPNGKCGVYGYAVDFDASKTGAQWSGNVWTPDGAAVPVPK